MKKYIVIICCFISFYGCDDDFLNQENPNTLTPDQFWNTSDDAQSAIVGTYSPLSTIFNHGRLFSGYTQSLSDAVHTTADFSYNASLYNLNPGDGNFTAGWGEYWKIVFRANLVLQNVPNIEMDSDLKNNILGEAYFLRAYSYFVLVNYFNNIPLVTVPAASLAETQQPQVEPALVWAQIKEDLNMAIPMLPNSWDDNNKGRVTAGAATALLGKTYLYQQEWSDAATQLKRVIDGEFGTYTLTSDYSDNFRLSGDNNSESLFEIQFDLTGAWTAGWGSDVPSTARYNSFGFDMSNAGSSVLNTWVLNLFLKDRTINGQIDPRAYETMVWNYPGAEHFNGESFATKFASQLAEDPNYVKAGKYINPNGGGAAPAFNTFAVNKKIIRFADVLLMYAEAENENNGPTSDAYAAVNQVRDRANMPDFTLGMSKDDFRQKVRDERVLELTLEDIRQLDLLRWGMLPDRIIDNPEFREGNNSYKPGREYFPIPQLEWSTNPNIVQNPGYE
ncbi:SusD-like protein [Formosa agariphila KMM 3901]|uniref:SusD-like protein n=1 Tax=Formosa agariphila (strain DSM 15362 / KCTC 12365 / LMG 23005 / KMM 3901 / M-2Alg 35-1) TaxID=1347342 RepID=T2KMI4_FORAG|nr:RagB/SusD family nutrient uptake outer membrane protein [Formosa agariphila]CDF79641.1 SusD-like protein [Formosa agariphila KMM 3901]